MFLIKPNTLKYCLIAISQLSVKTLRKQLRRWKEFNVVWKLYRKWICWVGYFYVNWSGRGKQTSFVRYSRTNFILCRNIHFMMYGFDEVCTDWLLSPTHLFWFAESYIAGDVVDSCWLLSQVWVASFYLCVEYIFHHHCIHHF